METLMMDDTPMTRTPMTVENPASPKPETPQALALYTDILRTGPSSHSALAIQPGNNSQSTIATPPRQLVHRRNSAPLYRNEEELDDIFNVAMARAQAQQQPPSSPDVSTALAIVTTLTSQPFRPNQMALVQQGLLTPSAHSSANSNTGYQGDLSSNSYLVQLPNLPDEENCALFVTNIPPRVTHPDMFDRIHVGPVFALHISPADATHSMQAAKLVFMDPEATHQMMRATVWMRGRRLDFRYNRYGYRKNDRNYTRVLIVEGPEAIMNLASWDRYFRFYSELVYDRVIKVYCATPGNKAYEFRFARIDGQAETCFLAIRAEPSFQGIITFRYGRDPCGV
jgi:hypothetical protein